MGIYADVFLAAEEEHCIDRAFAAQEEADAAKRSPPRAGDRVRDKRHCCAGTVVVDDRHSALGYTLVVDWDGGYRNTQHPDDVEVILKGSTNV